MRYGYFDIEKREYVITNPKTPVKWINYIGTREFGGFVDHTGGALICKEDPALNRITKYIQQMPSSDFKGETLYVRVKQGEDYQVFSPFYVPTLHELDRFECRIGLGYTRIVSELSGIQSDVTIFVPERGHCEVRDIQIKNISGEALQVDVIPLVEYTHPDALGQFTNADWIPQTMQSKAIVQDDGRIILIQYPFMLRDTKINYFTSNAHTSSFETDRRRFLGDNEYGGFGDPIRLHDESLSNSEALRGDNIAALLHPLGVLKPGETRRIVTQLGQTTTLEAAQEEIARFKDPEEVSVEKEKIFAFWERYLEVLQVHTPDERMNVMLNLFNPRQCFVTFTWSRYLSYYQLGMGARGIGIRDTAQDLMAVFASVPQRAKEFLVRILSFQKSDGSSVHQFNPLSNLGSAGDSMEMEDRYHFYSDDHLWMVMAAAAYIKETGDDRFLDQTIPYYEKDRALKPILSGTVLAHIERALEFTRGHVGEHGLPLLGFADWNDTVNLPKGAESLFTANLFGTALAEMIPIMDFSGHSELAKKYRRMYQEMKDRVASCAWDGGWYLRYFDHEGNPIGSSQNEYGQIYLNAQTWPVISGFASEDRARRAMEALYEKLYTENGLKISSPGFNGYDPTYGGVTTFPPGVKENGGIFVHPNAWGIIAETKIGNGDRAYAYYAATNPATRNEKVEVYECEPFVYAQNIISDVDHPQFGLARNSWLTGSAAWHYLACSQYILGIRPEIMGLRIDPCIPAEWDGFSVFRKFRGKMYTIEVHNPQHVRKGVVKVIVDGRQLEGNLLVPEAMHLKNHVEVWMGSLYEGQEMLD